MNTGKSFDRKNRVLAVVFCLIASSALVAEDGRFRPKGQADSDNRAVDGCQITSEPAQTRQGDAEPWNRYFDQTLSARMREGVNGGYALVVCKDGRMILHRAEGYARMPWERDKPGVKMTIDTPVQLASVTSPSQRLRFSRRGSCRAILSIWMIPSGQVSNARASGFQTFVSRSKRL